MKRKISQVSEGGQTFYILMSESPWMAGMNIASEGKKSGPGCFLDGC